MPRMTPKAWTALGAVYVFWGGTYLAIRFAVETLPPLLMAGARWVVAGAVMYAFGRRSGRGADPKPTARQWRTAAVIGAALCLGGNGLVSMAERRIASGVAALIVATVLLWIAGFDLARFRARLPRATVGGLLGGFGGTALLVLPRGRGAVDVIGALLVLAASASWAAGSLYARRADLPARPMTSTGMEMLAGGAALILVGAVGGELGRLEPGEVSRASLIGVAYLVVFGSLVAFSAYVWLLRNARTSIVSTYAYVNPLVAVLLGWAVKDEPVTALTALAGAIIVGSVAAIVGSNGAKQRAPDEVPPRRDLASEQLPT